MAMQRFSLQTAEAMLGLPTAQSHASISFGKQTAISLRVSDGKWLNHDSVPELRCRAHLHTQATTDRKQFLCATITVAAVNLWVHAGNDHVQCPFRAGSTVLSHNMLHHTQ